jgi:hypothetical protein
MPTPKQVRLIESICRNNRLCVPRQCEEHSAGRTIYPENLRPDEASELIEKLMTLDRSRLEAEHA